MNAQKRPIRTLIVIAVLIVVLGGGLALDLANRGLAWQAFWTLTGEETPLAQFRGLIEVAGNLTRPQPQTAPYTPIQHAGVYPFGINTFLEQEAEIIKREESLRLISAAGFGWIRQQFPWADIEIHGRGDFEDRRNDLNGDGQPDAVSAWDKYDNIVSLAEQYGIEIQARLDNAPDWAQTVSGDYAPPADFQDFVNYAVAVAERYRGRIRYYQVWNEPNIYPEWGDQAVNPEAFTELLCRTYDALKAVDPDIVVIGPPLSPTVSLTQRDLNDFIFLQRMYDAGAGDCFDVMSVQGYGFFSGPTDQRMRTTSLTFARNLYIRDLMIRNGDAHKPIWISEVAWNPIDSADVPPDVSAREAYGVVTQAQAATYMPAGYQRAAQEWPWVGVMHYWFFKRPADYERGQSWYYFRMMEPDFTPLPIYDAMREYITNLTPTLYRGVHQADHWAITRPDDAEPVTAAEAQFEQAAELSQVTFTAHGTSIRLRWQVADSAALNVSINGGTPQRITPGSGGWNESTLISSLLPQTHTITVTGDTRWLFDSVMVYDYGVDHAAAMIVGGLIAVAALISGVIVVQRRRA